jgi:hypothetical protein
LINLEDVEIENFKGGFREIDFLEASVFRCAPMTKVTVKLASKADKLLLRNWTFVPFTGPLSPLLSGFGNSRASVPSLCLCP